MELKGSEAQDFAEFVISIRIPTRNQIENSGTLLSRLSEAMGKCQLELYLSTPVDATIDHTADVVRSLENQISLSQPHAWKRERSF